MGLLKTLLILIALLHFLSRLSGFIWPKPYLQKARRLVQNKNNLFSIGLGSLIVGVILLHETLQKTTFLYVLGGFMGLALLISGMLSLFEPQLYYDLIRYFEKKPAAALRKYCLYGVIAALLVLCYLLRAQ